MTTSHINQSNAPGRLDAEAKASGRIRYVADVVPPGVLYAAVERSRCAHARIIGIDTAAAREAPGVVGVFTAADISAGTYGRGVRDAPILAGEKVRFVGERVAAVVARTRAEAEAAAALVEVSYEILPAAVTIDEALAPGAPVIHERAWAYPGAVIAEGEAPNLVAHHFRGGDVAEVESALDSATHVVDEVYELSSVHQAYLEPQAAIAWWDDGRLKLWLTNKSPYMVRKQLGECFDLDPETFEIQSTYLGGDFGGKGSPEDAPLVAELARLTDAPVKIVLRYQEDLTATNPRAPARIRVRVGCDGGGLILGTRLECTFDAGAYGAFTGSAEGPRGTDLNGYRIPRFAAEVRRVYTNTVPRGHMRAPGDPQGCFAFESALDELADKAGIDPVEIRRRNLLRDGQADPEGHVRAEERGHLTLDAALSSLERREAPPGWLRGIGTAVYSRETPMAVSTSLRIVPVDDRCVRVELPFTETGTGSYSVARSLVARGLGLDPGDVEVVGVGTDKLPRDTGAGGSRVTASVGAVVDAAVKAWQSRLDDGPVEVELDERSGEPPVGSYCVQIAQVAVDPETGQLKVLEIFDAVDVAEIINPKAHQMQIDGAVIMGYGYACLEDLDESDGHVWAANLGDFKIPSARDAPDLQTVLIHGGRGVTTANVKSIGEMALPAVAPAIANALADATGCRLRALPLRAEDVFHALKAQAAGGVRVAFTLNGEAVEAEATDDALLVEVIRGLGWTGTKEACGVGVCGVCTVLVRDLPVSSCLYFAAMAEGAEVWTAEGLVGRDPALLDAFVTEEGMQCGICTPGQVVAAYALGLDHPDADEAEIRAYMAGNLCRCTGYSSIVNAVRAYLAGR